MQDDPSSLESKYCTLASGNRRDLGLIDLIILLPAHSRVSIMPYLTPTTDNKTSFKTQRGDGFECCRDSTHATHSYAEQSVVLDFSEAFAVAVSCSNQL
jgi:hypothetical protein